MPRNALLPVNIHTCSSVSSTGAGDQEIFKRLLEFTAGLPGLCLQHGGSRANQKADVGAKGLQTPDESCLPP
jgi:hypothetical protein